MSYRSIRITFENAIQQANQLSDCARELQDAQRRMDSIMEGLRREWQGDAANQYLAKCEAMKNRFNTTAVNLNNISGAIRSAAQAYYDAEMAALEIIATQSGG